MSDKELQKKYDKLKQDYDKLLARNTRLTQCFSEQNENPRSLKEPCGFSVGDVVCGQDSHGKPTAVRIESVVNGGGVWRGQELLVTSGGVFPSCRFKKVEL